MSKSDKLPAKLPLRPAIKTTLDLKKLLLQSLEDLTVGEITPNQARARAFLARTTLDAIRVEIYAARVGLVSYRPVPLLETGEKIIDAE